MVTITLLLFITTYILLFHSQSIDAQSIPATCLPSSVCNSTIYCSEHGHCYYDLMEYNSNRTNENLEKCICDTGYATQNNTGIHCCYEQKSQIMAFLMEFVVGFGLGHFYIGNYVYFYVNLLAIVYFAARFIL